MLLVCPRFLTLDVAVVVVVVVLVVVVIVGLVVSTRFSVLNLSFLSKRSATVILFKTLGTEVELAASRS